MLKQLSTLFCHRAMSYTTFARKKDQRNPVMTASPLSISLQSSRLFSTKEEKNVFNNKPIKVYYINPKTPIDKLRYRIKYDTEGKVGVYSWLNRKTGKSYIGSSQDLGNTANYFFDLINSRYTPDSKKIAVKAEHVALIKAIQKTGISNFSFNILTYCEEKKLDYVLLIYLIKKVPEYNLNLANHMDQLHGSIIKAEAITQTPDCSASLNYIMGGASHARATDKNILDNEKDLNINPPTAPKSLILYQPITLQLITTLGSSKPETILATSKQKTKNIKFHTEETKTKISLSLRGRVLNEAIKAKMKVVQKNRIKCPKPGFAIQVLDLENEKITLYSSYREVERALNMGAGTITRRIKGNITNPYKKRYIISKNKD
jgi:group I intron endonuclease